ncbi:tyrosine-type recombinase/integrase [Tepidibacter hydrothermalis]|uniref:Tyrosine-type recombinase/integrase n=1 Tax=Tepidibacter hydrothermalis TaxID=3036126 RepID=A0ABY8E820_9FIRM|nr:tyrosine-type recombinase/integrase [Tepidibacter hydrothermalis]WFD09033.1 tyrosine-type recombinase/integrase [Tepidibacter hydrothermalis]
MLNIFKNYLKQESKSENTIKSYIRHIKGYIKWFKDSYDTEFNKLYRENVLEFKSYLKNIKKDSPKTVNAKLSALIKFNEFLQSQGIQNDIVISKKDFNKIQIGIASPTDITRCDVEKFRQKVLENEGKRNYAIVTVMAYTGLRISEVLNITMNDFNTVSREIIIKSGKGDKTRTVYMNDRVKDSIQEYLKERKSQSEYLFVSNKGNCIDRTVINKMFKKYSEKITPHILRYFWCTYALENGLNVHEVANLAGHSNIQTTLLYTNPNRKQLLDKINKL